MRKPERKEDRNKEQKTLRVMLNWYRVLLHSVNFWKDLVTLRLQFVACAVAYCEAWKPLCQQVGLSHKHWPSGCRQKTKRKNSSHYFFMDLGLCKPAIVILNPQLYLSNIMLQKTKRVQNVGMQPLNVFTQTLSLVQCSLNFPQNLELFPMKITYCICDRQQLIKRHWIQMWRS